MFRSFGRKRNPLTIPLLIIHPLLVLFLFLFPFLIVLLAFPLLPYASVPDKSGPRVTAEEIPAVSQTATTLHILSTSDIHCRYLPYDYSKDREDKQGSMSRLSAIVNQIRDNTDNSILIDVGDAIQGSLSRTYLDAAFSPSGRHPFAAAANYMRYDVWVLGNHEFNFGIDALRSVMKQVHAQVLCGNVYGPDGSPFAPSCTIIDKNGIRIGIIGMVTPSVAVFSSEKLRGCKVTNPLDETKKAAAMLRGQCDILIAAEHMGVDEEYGVYGSGAEDIARECPEIDVILAAHAHTRVREKFVNGVLITENRKLGKTLSDVQISLIRSGDGRWHVLGKKAYSIDACRVDPDPGFLDALSSVKKISDRENDRVVGTLTGIPLSVSPFSTPGQPTREATLETNASQKMLSADTAEVAAAFGEGHKAETADEKGSALLPLEFDPEIPQSARGESTLADFINQVQISYTGAEASATSLLKDTAGPESSRIKVSDLCRLYPDDYTIFKLRLTGRQLKTYMEWSAGYYDAREADSDAGSGSCIQVAPSSDRKSDDCDIFYGIRYQVRLSKPKGSRIENLRHMDGSPVRDTDSIILVVNRVRAADLTVSDRIFPAGQPHAEIIQGDVHDEYSGLREMIGDYITSHSDAEGCLKITGTAPVFKLTA